MSEQKQPAEVGPVELVLGPLPEPEELDWNRHAEPVFGYTRQQMEAERQRCYELGVATERERWRAAAQKADDALTWAHGGEPLPTLEREALDLLRPLLRA